LILNSFSGPFLCWVLLPGRIVCLLRLGYLSLILVVQTEDELSLRIVVIFLSSVDTGNMDFEVFLLNERLSSFGCFDRVISIYSLLWILSVYIFRRTMEYFDLRFLIFVSRHISLCALMYSLESIRHDFGSKERW
jgi:hypothetical protein